LNIYRKEGDSRFGKGKKCAPGVSPLKGREEKVKAGDHHLVIRVAETVQANCARAEEGKSLPKNFNARQTEKVVGLILDKKENASAKASKNRPRRD